MGQPNRTSCPDPVVLVCAAAEYTLATSVSVFQAELQKLRQQALETKHFIEKQEAEERKLLRIIAEADGERMRQKKELDQVAPPPRTLTQCSSCEFSALSKPCHGSLWEEP